MTTKIKTTAWVKSMHRKENMPGFESHLTTHLSKREQLSPNNKLQ